MFSKILSALTLVRHAVAITLVTGAATTMVAGSLDVASGSHPTTNVGASSTSTVETTTSSQNKTTNDLEAFVKACLATKDPQSTACAQAIDKSGMSAPEFWATVAMYLHEQLTRQTSEKSTATPKPEPTAKPDAPAATHPVVTGELLALVSACVESHERSSDACQKALEASGLPAEDFWARVAAKFGTTSEPTTKPVVRTGDESFSMLIKDCLYKYEAAKNTGNTAMAGDACKKAIEASGLTSSDFWARFGPVGRTNKTEPTTKPDTTRPTTKPETKPSGTPTVSTAQLEVMVKDCFAKYLIAKETHEGGSAALEACNKAIAASGLSGDAFWKKFGLPGATSN